MRRSSIIRCLSRVIGETSVIDDNIKTGGRRKCPDGPLAAYNRLTTKNQLRTTSLSNCRSRLSSTSFMRHDHTTFNGGDVQNGSVLPTHFGGEIVKQDGSDDNPFALYGQPGPFREFCTLEALP